MSRGSKAADGGLRVYAGERRLDLPGFVEQRYVHQGQEYLYKNPRSECWYCIAAGVPRVEFEAKTQQPSSAWGIGILHPGLVAIARARPGKILWCKPGRDNIEALLDPALWVEMPESAWHHGWQTLQQQRACSYTTEMHAVLKALVLEGRQPGAEQEREVGRLERLQLVIRDPLGGVMATERGQDVARHYDMQLLHGGTAKNQIDIGKVLTVTDSNKRDAAKKSVEQAREELAGAQAHVVETLGRHLRQQASFEEVEQAYLAFERLRAERGADEVMR